jgi:6-phosphogluconolactonase (cycloisomerase 2 family)
VTSVLKRLAGSLVIRVRGEHSSLEGDQKNMRTLTRIAATLGLTALAVAGSGGHVPGAHADFGLRGYVYVNDNTAMGGNTVVGFSENGDGTLSPIPGSPFNVGGAGLGAGLGSQNAIETAYGGRFLLVADAGSSQISVLHILPNGGLQPVPGSPFASGGTQPVSIAVSQNLVYVANTGAVSNYAGFSLSPSGTLTPLAAAPFAVPQNSVLGDVLFNGDGRHLIGIRVGANPPTVASPSLIDSFTIDHNGGLIAAPGSPYPAQAAGPLGSAFRPTNPNQLFVSNAHAGAGLGSVSAYNVGFNGTLNALSGSPFADMQTAPCWVAVSPDGRYLVAANTASGSISSYSINWNGSLTIMGELTVSGAAPVKPTDLDFDPSGQVLYGLEGGLNALNMVRVHDGYLLEAPTSPIALPAGGAPSGLVVTPSF